MSIQTVQRETGGGHLRIAIGDDRRLHLTDLGGGMPVGIHFTQAEARATAHTILQMTDRPRSAETREGIRHALMHLDLPLSDDNGIVDYD